MPPSVHVIPGDITKVSADALITAINSGGMWFGGIDGAIQRAAGNMFHQQADQALPLAHGATVFARGNDETDFQNVAFVIDDLAGPLSDVIYNGLVCASQNGAKSVTIPTLRMGVMRGKVEKTPEEVIEQMAIAVERYRDSDVNGIEDITFVVYGDHTTELLLLERFSAISA